MAVQSRGEQNQLLPAQATAAEPALRVSAHAPVVPAVASAAVNSGSIALRYLEKSRVRVVGLGTGRSYEFSETEALQDVDARDAAPLLNTRFFRRA